MSKQPLVEKASGEKQAFDPEKLKTSLKRAGTPDDLADSIVSDIIPDLHEGISTREIYQKAFNILRSHRRSNAARYSLKKAIMELGPTGYPFEHFVGQVLAQHGFTIEVGQVLQGKCVTHEVDVIATNNSTQYLVECKFYNSQDKYANVKVPLYIRSRVNDIIQFREQLPEYKDTRFFGWIVTNTRFTEDALVYGRCAGLNLVSWDFPKNNSLKDLVETAGLFPVTALTMLSKHEKQRLMDKGIVLCSQILKEPSLLDEFRMNKGKISNLIKEAEDLSQQRK